MLILAGFIQTAAICPLTFYWLPVSVLSDVAFVWEAVVAYGCAGKYAYATPMCDSTIVVLCIPSNLRASYPDDAGRNKITFWCAPEGPEPNAHQCYSSPTRRSRRGCATMAVNARGLNRVASLLMANRHSRYCIAVRG